MAFWSLLMFKAREGKTDRSTQGFIKRRAIEESAETIPGFLHGELVVSTDDPDLLVSPLLVIGGADAKWFHNSIAKNVYRMTTVRVESAADVGRLHGVNERVLVNEYAKSIGFYYQFLANAQSL